MWWHKMIFTTLNSRMFIPLSLALSFSFSRWWDWIYIIFLGIPGYPFPSRFIWCTILILHQITTSHLHHWTKEENVSESEMIRPSTETGNEENFHPLKARGKSFFSTLHCHVNVDKLSLSLFTPFVPLYNQLIFFFWD